MRKLYFILFICFISCNSSDNNDFQLQIGDILFQDLDSSPLCDAIEIVTPGYNNYNFSHIGIIVELGDPNCINPNYIYEDNIRVLEAIPNKVTTTRLDSFLNRSIDSNKKPKVIVGRLKKRYQFSILDAVKFLKSKIGLKYDDYFIKDNNKYYCSELIYEAFEKDSIFRLYPMTFIDPVTKNTMNLWEEYYNELETKIPEGEPGINPGVMSISENIEIIHKYGQPSRKNNE
ncbi:YiiX/YebB-like N1pC/P60 family cysteine hydrolase [Flavobacteriales bacterium]|nr:YiiX/YebB-like N1pC/P60 family cysteine hydrolase [Flavobacteriales bacterium]MDC1062851.1 YiiX/YebB-like N1pC/P60 family cysteine hydrolase [Flavobacteriales bacterium]